MKEKDKQMRTVWDIPNNKSKDEMKFGSHPTQKPLRVSERILTLCGVKDGKLLIPFAGSGTEMVAGLNFGMNVTGFEIDNEYIDIAQKRLEDALQKKKNFFISMKPLQPVIKWSGSKRTVASQLGEFFLPAQTYYEPFVGGGAMMPFAKADKGKASDIIPELIALWNEIKNNPEVVANEYEIRWNRLQNEGFQVVL